MEWAAAGDAGKRRDVDRLVEMGHHVVAQPLEDVLVNVPRRGTTASKYGVPPSPSTKMPRDFAPEQRALAVIVGALRDEGARHVEELLVVSAEALHQSGVRCEVLRGGERELRRIDRDDDGIDALPGVGGTVQSCGADCERSCGCIVAQNTIGHPALDVMHRRLKPDEMRIWRSPEMQSLQEAQADHGHAALARCAAAGQNRGRAAVLLPHVIFTSSHHDVSTMSASM